MILYFILYKSPHFLSFLIKLNKKILLVDINNKIRNSRFWIDCLRGWRFPVIMLGLRGSRRERWLTCLGILMCVRPCLGGLVQFPICWGLFFLLSLKLQRRWVENLYSNLVYIIWSFFFCINLLLHNVESLIA